MSDLKPCPFCGGAPFTHHIEPHQHDISLNGVQLLPDHEGSYTIECAGCGLGIIDDTLEAVTATWNRRTPDSALLREGDTALAAAIRERDEARELVEATQRDQRRQFKDLTAARAELTALRAQVDAAREQGRREGLEEAAQAADQQAFAAQLHGDPGAMVRKWMQNLASAIRTLAAAPADSRIPTDAGPVDILADTPTGEPAAKDTGPTDRPLASGAVPCVSLAPAEEGPGAGTIPTPAASPDTRVVREPGALRAATKAALEAVGRGDGPCPRCSRAGSEGTYSPCWPCSEASRLWRQAYALFDDRGDHIDSGASTRGGTT